MIILHPRDPSWCAEVLPTDLGVNVVITRDGIVKHAYNVIGLPFHVVLDNVHDWLRAL